jgi:hypothetical protein
MNDPRLPFVDRAALLVLHRRQIAISWNRTCRSSRWRPHLGVLAMAVRQAATGNRQTEGKLLLGGVTFCWIIYALFTQCE